MIGLDTNVLIRYITADDAEQFQRAEQLIEQQSTKFYINHIVLCELVWVLNRAYHYNKTTIVLVLEKILNTEQLVIEEQQIVQQAIDTFKISKADFADCLIGIKNQQRNCQTTVSFDFNTSQLTFFTLL